MLFIKSNRTKQAYDESEQVVFWGTLFVFSWGDENEPV